MSRPRGAPSRNGAPTRRPNSHVFSVNGRSLLLAIDVEAEAAVEVIGLPRDVITRIAAPMSLSAIFRFQKRTFDSWILKTYLPWRLDPILCEQVSTAEYQANDPLTESSLRRYRPLSVSNATWIGCILSPTCFLLVNYEYFAILVQCIRSFRS